MKILTTILLLISFNLYSKTIYFELKSNNTYWIKQSKLNILPGDTLIISGNAESITFVNFKGTKKQPIIITNKGIVKVNYSGNKGLGINNCQFVKLKFKCINNSYGLVIKSNNTHEPAINIYKFSSDIELLGIEVASSGFAGIMAKTNPDPNNNLTWRKNYVLNNLNIHDNYIHNTEGEGMYIGYYTYSKVNGVYPHSVKNVKIWNNIIENTGWDGIQVACADENSHIFNNKIKYFGLKNEFAQNSGMSINSGFNGKINNNLISLGTGNGINIMPLDSAIIENNKILKLKNNSYGIYIQNNKTMHKNCIVIIKNNTIEAKTSLYVHNKTNTQFKEIKFINNILINNYLKLKIIPNQLKYKKYIVINNNMLK